MRVDYIAPDWKEVHVSMKLRWYNRNVVGTHFGGSLYSMVDPHLMLMLMNLLGKEYIVWDRSARIDFIRPGKGRVYSKLKLSNDDINTIRESLKIKSKVLPEFDVTIYDEQEKPVAKVKKILYVRCKERGTAKTQDEEFLRRHQGYKL